MSSPSARHGHGITSPFLKPSWEKIRSDPMAVPEQQETQTVTHGSAHRYSTCWHVNWLFCAGTSGAWRSVFCPVVSGSLEKYQHETTVCLRASSPAKYSDSSVARQTDYITIFTLLCTLSDLSYYLVPMMAAHHFFEYYIILIFILFKVQSSDSLGAIPS